MADEMAYIVTQGSYSDYGIRRVYLDEAEAQAYVDLVNASENNYETASVEEWPIGDSKYFRGTVHNVRLTEGGVNPLRREAWSYLEDGQDFVGRAEVRLAEVNKHGVLHVYVRGTDADQVDKSAQDAWASVKAAAAGVGQPQ